MMTPQFPVNNLSVDLIYSIKKWLDHLVNDLSILIELVENFVSDIGKYFAFLPTEVVVVLVATFSVVALLMILGKGT